MKQVGLYFWVNGVVLKESIPLAQAIEYGDMLTSASGHYDVWEEQYAAKYRCEYDYYPRGRVVYNRITKQSILYLDKCISIEGQDAIKVEFGIDQEDVILASDMHYVCHKCNEGYTF